MKRHAGVSMVEYGIILSLVAIAAAVGLVLLGGSLINLLGQGSGQINQYTASANPADTGGGGLDLSQISIDRLVPVDAFGNWTGSGGNNPPAGNGAGSSDGGDDGTSAGPGGTASLSTMGTIILARRIEHLASESSNPAVREWAMQLAAVSYYLSAAQGSLDGLGAYSVLGSYPPDAAVADVQRFNGMIATLLANAPAQVRQSGSYGEIRALASQISAISQSYASRPVPIPTATTPVDSLPFEQMVSLSLVKASANQALRDARNIPPVNPRIN